MYYIFLQLCIFFIEQAWIYERKISLEVLHCFNIKFQVYYLANATFRVGFYRGKQLAQKTLYSTNFKQQITRHISTTIAIEIYYEIYNLERAKVKSFGDISFLRNLGVILILLYCIV